MQYQTYLQKTKDELKLRYYSPKTQKSYLACLNKYLSTITKDIREADIEHIKKFLLKKQEKKHAPQTINLYLNAIKFFYRNVVHSPAKINIHFAKTPRKLPVILTRAEITKILDATQNPKHKTLIALAYGAGLRVSEVINLKIKDLDLNELTIHLKQTKGKKERITVIPKKLKADLERLITEKDNDEYVFESERGTKISTRGAQKIFKNAIKKADIKKGASFHSLRHSFATHLLENGVNIRYVQELLGHQNIRTTQRYTQVANPAIKNIKSPL